MSFYKNIVSKNVFSTSERVLVEGHFANDVTINHFNDCHHLDGVPAELVDTTAVNHRYLLEIETTDIFRHRQSDNKRV